MNFPHEHGFILQDERILTNARKSQQVLYLTAAMMMVEIVAGYVTHSMALLADGWHMASHSAAMVISLIAYRLGRSPRINTSLSFGAGKLIPLGGYTSALILAMISVLMAEESIRRLLRPEAIQFNEAIGIAAIGLAVNLLSAWLLEAGDHGHAHEAEEGHDHPHEHHHDHNLRSAYLHVLADALTSVLAIVALGFGKFYGLGWMDPVMGIVGSLVILRWAYGLCRDTGYELLDVHSKQVPPEEIRRVLQPHGIETLDIHTWRIAPNAIAGELVVETAALRGADYYRELLRGQVEVHHLIIEERLLIGK